MQYLSKTLRIDEAPLLTRNFCEIRNNGKDAELVLLKSGDLCSRHQVRGFPQVRHGRRDRGQANAEYATAFEAG